MYSPLTTSSRQDFILLRIKNLNKDIKFIEKFYFILHAVSPRR